ncbi:hypothetical protein J437_LFUL009045, partial [Ladona fulva]
MPILGCFLEFRKLRQRYKAHFRIWQEFAEKYGDIVGLRLGRSLYVLVSGKDAIHEGLFREEFCGRENMFLIREKTGISFNDGEGFKEQRRFALRNLKDLGFGKRTMESVIREEALELTSRLTEIGKKAGSGGVEMENMYTIPALNTLWSMMSGQRYSQEDEDLRKFTNIVLTVSRSISSAAWLISSFPWLRFFSSWFTKHSHLRKELWSFFEGTVRYHKKTITDGEPRDLIDTYLDEITRREGQKSSFTEQQLISLCDDLFCAGTETTSNTLAIGTLYLLHNPDVQMKIHEEMDRVVGRDRAPTMDDKPNLPYLNAVLMEIRRCCNVGALTVPHKCTRDTTFRGYAIPKGCLILFRLRSVHMDPEHWGDPEVFRPERFLIPGENGEPMKLKEEPSWLIPFGLGQRRCIGQEFALQNLYIFFSVILHGLSFKSPPGCDLPSTEGVAGFIQGSGPFKA